MRKGDWRCPICTAHNFAARDACYRCNHRIGSVGLGSALNTVASHPGHAGTDKRGGFVTAAGRSCHFPQQRPRHSTDETTDPPAAGGKQPGGAPPNPTLSFTACADDPDSPDRVHELLVALEGGLSLDNFAAEEARDSQRRPSLRRRGGNPDVTDHGGAKKSSQLCYTARQSCGFATAIFIGICTSLMLYCCALYDFHETNTTASVAADAMRLQRKPSSAGLRVLPAKLVIPTPEPVPTALRTNEYGPHDFDFITDFVRSTSEEVLVDSGFLGAGQDRQSSDVIPPSEAHDPHRSSDTARASHNHLDWRRVAEGSETLTDWRRIAEGSDELRTSRGHRSRKTAQHSETQVNDGAFATRLESLSKQFIYPGHIPYGTPPRSNSEAEAARLARETADNNIMMKAEHVTDATATTGASTESYDRSLSAQAKNAAQKPRMQTNFHPDHRNIYAAVKHALSTITSQQSATSERKKAATMQIFTSETLARHTSIETGLLIAVKGRVFDVTFAQEALGPGTSLHWLCGHDISLALAHESVSESNVNSAIAGDLSGLTQRQWHLLDKWTADLGRTFPIVGLLRAASTQL
jgi:predicted heme/steroid binding protein